MSLPRLRLRNGRFATIEQLIQDLQNPTPLLQRVGSYLRDSIRARIKTTKTAPDGTPWAPWAFVTEMARERKGTAGYGLLYDSGALYNSIDYQVVGKQVIAGAGVSYAKFLQAGTPNMPARPFVGISAQDDKNIDAIVRDYLKLR